DLLFRLGVREYSEGRTDDALQYMLASHRLVPNRNVEFNIARCFEELGMLDEAWRHYDDYARAEPDPQARAEAEAALLRLGQRVARVEITSDPPGATVYVDRVDLGPRGQTPLTLAMSEGKHPIVLDLPGHARAERTAELVVGQKTLSRITLAPLPPDAPMPAQQPGTWSVEVRAGSQVLVRVSQDDCALFPATLQGAGKPREPHLPQQAPQGSVRATTARTPPLLLDVSWEGATTRQALERVDKRATVLRDASSLRVWVFDRCEPTDPGGLAQALASMPMAGRIDAITVFAEWAATRGAPDLSRASSLCSAGDCRPLVSGLVGQR
ncbi:MAG: PEGA domain-containing protein, partial [Myxococcales bacterium]|nr:PEGA domain-containing protein [Myxococcales bacterium]